MIELCLFRSFVIFPPLFTGNVGYTQKRNRKATLFQWKIHEALFKVSDRDKGPSSFQEKLTNSTKYCLK